MLPESILGETFLEKYIDHSDAVTVIDEKRTYVVRAPAKHPIYENFRVKAFKALLTSTSSDEQLSALEEISKMEVGRPPREAHRPLPPGLESVRKVGSEFLGMEAAAAAANDSDISIGEMTASPSNTIIAFPRLKTLSFYSLEKWEEWEGEGRRNEDKTIMPSLRSLLIYDCPKLKALPDSIYQSTPLEELRIIRSPILEEQFKEGGKGWPNTSHTPNITLI